MTTYSVRCCVAKCRHRRVIKRDPDTYKRPPTCPKCGSKNGWRVEGREYNQRKLCTCSGPEMSKGNAFPHRTTHPLCEHHPHGPYNQAKKRGISDDDIPLEHLGRRMKDTDECPF